MLYIEVEDPQKHLDRIVAAGGTVVVPVTEIPGATTFAHFADPEGNVLGIYRPADR
jgi:predicted enzyme related to lactoylglutathione lyase